MAAEESSGLVAMQAGLVCFNGIHQLRSGLVATCRKLIISGDRLAARPQKEPTR